MPVMDQYGNVVATDGTLYRKITPVDAPEVSSGDGSESIIPDPDPEGGEGTDPEVPIDPDPRPDPVPSRPVQPREETFMIVGKDIEYLGSENDRGSIAIPETNVLYIVVFTNRMYIYYQNKWKCLNAALESFYDIFNVELKADTTTKITDVNISESTDAVFIPDPEVYDLATAESVKLNITTYDGYLEVKSTCHYPLTGIIQLVNGG